MNLLELGPGVSIEHIGHPFSLDRLNGVIHSGTTCTK